MTEPLTIGTLAKQAGVNVETIRFYQRRRLLDEPDKPPGGIRRYSQTHARRIRFIKEAQKLGFDLDEVADLLALEEGRHCREVEEIAGHKTRDHRPRYRLTPQLDSDAVHHLRDVRRHRLWKILLDDVAQYAQRGGNAKGLELIDL